MPALPCAARIPVSGAGLEPWPKLFQNLRLTRETELAEEYPLHVVCAWIGNSQPVAAKHYLQVTESHFEKAVLKAYVAAPPAASPPPRRSNAEVYPPPCGGPEPGTRK